VKPSSDFPLIVSVLVAKGDVNEGKFLRIAICINTFIKKFVLGVLVVVLIVS